MYYRRILALPEPWTDDRTLRTSRFTNAYRASDRVSQYLIGQVQYAPGTWIAHDYVFRTILFKLFNRIDTWERLGSHLGEIRYSEFQAKTWASIMSRIRADGPIYSAAYIVPPVPSSQYEEKHWGHLDMLASMMRAADELLAADSLQSIFEWFLRFDGIGPFLAYQLTVDLNYSPLFDFSEDSFVVAGPGAKRGIDKCFRTRGGLSYEDVIRIVCDSQEEAFGERGIEFPTLFGRRLHLIDCQNLFCEVDKYARVAHPEFSGPRTRIKQRFRPSGPVPKPWFPPKWNLNESVSDILS